jgi:transposase
VCHGRDILHHGSLYRLWRQVPIGPKPIFIQMGIRRMECRQCSAIRQVKVRFADERRSFTRAFERYALELSRHMTIRDVARHLKLRALRQIAIDEISSGKGQRYLTVVLDLDTGAVVFVGDGNGAEALQPFWRRLKRSRARIEAVAMDMSKAYIRAVMENLPAATIVFDHFHVVKLFNDKLQEFRRQLFNQAQSEMEKKCSRAHAGCC